MTSNLADVRSFDPDIDDPYVEPGEEAVIHVDDDLIEIDEDAALALLAKVTAALPDGGEAREGQQMMVRAIAAGLSRRRHVVIEAGTGVGKSLGYLVPLAQLKRRVIVATATKNLQDQLATKDAPLVAAQAHGLRVAVLKGRSNYLCRLRVREVGGDGQMAFEDGDEVPKGVASQMRRVLEWAKETTTGERDELSFEVDPPCVASAVGHTAGVPRSDSVPPWFHVFRRSGQRRRGVERHRDCEFTPLRVAPRGGQHDPARSRRRGLRRGPRSSRHLCDTARNIPQRHALSRGGHFGPRRARQRGSGHHH